jgi:hypothetical protein
MITKIIWFLTLRHRALFLVCVSSPRLNKCSVSSDPLNAKYVELMGKENVYNSSYVYCQVKGWSKRAKKTFSMILKRVFQMVLWTGEKMKSHQKRYF